MSLEPDENGGSTLPWCGSGVVSAADNRPRSRMDSHNQRFQRKNHIAAQPCENPHGYVTFPAVRVVKSACGVVSVWSRDSIPG